MFTLATTYTHVGPTFYATALSPSHMNTEKLPYMTIIIFQQQKMSFLVKNNGEEKKKKKKILI